jgi:hypothetical protein
MKGESYITLTLTVDPQESAARIAVSAAPEGYDLVEMDRRLNRAVCVYRLREPLTGAHA